MLRDSSYSSVGPRLCLFRFTSLTRSRVGKDSTNSSSPLITSMRLILISLLEEPGLLYTLFHCCKIMRVFQRQIICAHFQCINTRSFPVYTRAFQVRNIRAFPVHKYVFPVSKHVRVSVHKYVRAFQTIHIKFQCV